MDLLNHLSPPSGGDSAPSTANTSAASAPSPSALTPAPAAVVSGGGGRGSRGPIASCYEVIYQEIKLPSENFIRFREWFSSVTHCEEKDALTIEEARNVIKFAHLHLSENPEVTRGYSITLLRKNCHLNPPSFYRLAKWSHEIRELEKHKKPSLAAAGGAGGGGQEGGDSSAKWEAVKHCIHHGVFPTSHRIVPINGSLCASCAALEAPHPSGGGELVRSQSSKDHGTASAVSASGVALERSASGHTLPSQRDLKVCDRCGKPFPAVGNVQQQLSHRSLGDPTPGAPASAKQELAPPPATAAAPSEGSAQQGSQGP
jgi:hypothetical protein